MRESATHHDLAVALPLLPGPLPRLHLHGFPVLLYGLEAIVQQGSELLLRDWLVLGDVQAHLLRSVALQGER